LRQLINGSQLRNGISCKTEENRKRGCTGQQHETEIGSCQHPGDNLRGQRQARRRECGNPPTALLRFIQRIHGVVEMCNTGPGLGEGAMAQTVCVVLSTMERKQLAAIAADRNRPHKHVERARIVLTSADRHSAQRIAQSVSVSRPTVWRWQQRFAESGVEGLLRDKTRKPGKAPIAAETVARVVALTDTAPPHQATHWTGRAMANAISISVGSVQRIWRAHKLQPHRLRTFKRSRDPGFAAKPTGIVGLYVDPPAHAVVLSIDEKSQIQALDRTQPGLPIKPGRCQTMTHDYKRHGTTTLFAALSVLDGTVIGRCMQRHRHSEFIRFLNAIERQVPAGMAWLARHPRWIFDFTPTSASWLNAVETFFSKVTRQRIRRGVFRSIADLQAAINAYRPGTTPAPSPLSDQIRRRHTRQTRPSPCTSRLIQCTSWFVQRDRERIPGRRMV
jgi:transposase